MYSRKGSRSVGTFHHRNPFEIRTIIDNDLTRPKNRKGSSNNILANANRTSANDKSKKPKTRMRFFLLFKNLRKIRELKLCTFWCFVYKTAGETTRTEATKKDDNFNEIKKSSIPQPPSPHTPVHTIPPPWKVAATAVSHFVCNLTFY